MSELDDDIMRGCLPNGEPVEARWGMGWWSGWDDRLEPDYYGDECPFCHETAYFVDGQFQECQKCQKTFKDLAELF